MTKQKLFSAAVILLALFSFGKVNAQKYCYVNSEYILENVPDYKNAMQQIDNVSIQWQKEIEDKYSIIDKLYKAYQSEQILLTEDMKKRRQDEILQKEKDVKDLQKKRFGVDGDLFKKKQELIKPIQDKVYNAIKKMADAQGYAVVFDKSSDLTMLYTNPKYDKSNDILLAMGFKPGKKDSGTSGENKGGSGEGEMKPPVNETQEKK